MTSLVESLIVVAVVGALGFYYWERHDSAKAQILSDLGRLHASRIEIAVDWSDWSRESVAFTVEYSTPDGTRHVNECRVSTGLGGVAWARPLKGAA